MVDVPNQAVNEARGPGGCGKTGQRQATSWPIVMPRRRFSIVISGPHGDKTGHAMREAMAETGVRAAGSDADFGTSDAQSACRRDGLAGEAEDRELMMQSRRSCLGADGNNGEHMAAGAKSAVLFRCPGRHVSA
ncbi:MULTISPECIES: hypothetical protein [unclassified Burkholderia]|uniref:hypothetical protein n=1 Tax=unclassified Burkholderia TaxID=2613784 RepID=UPI00075F38AF|nr:MULTISPECIES: hypothetical protein [unclassified Burkholderia]KUY99867.1 hypothetical protein WS48_08735 [Burkholderia sp. RF7-non_BP1]KUZ04002.1 hypothetical protein WS49_10715 [Burkholderia sp. RF7-non_BP4]